MLKSNIYHEHATFPKGESQFTVRAHHTITNEFNVIWEFEKESEVIQLLLLIDAARNSGLKIGVLELPYVPYSRQDRIANEGENFSLGVICNLINSIGFRRVIIMDPHSDVTPALIHNVEVIPQHEIFRKHLALKRDYWLVSPDGGALKKIYKLAAETHSLGVIECSKKRDTQTGKITGTVVHVDDLQDADCYIVDDICDGGYTFIEIAKALQKKGAGEIHLMVTHGFFTKGLGVFDDLIQHIYTRNGKIK